MTPARRVRVRLGVPGLAAVALGLPAAAEAQAPTPAPAPAPAAATLSLRAERLMAPGFAVRGQRWRVRGAVTPFVAGQAVSVVIAVGGRKVKAQTEAIQATPGGRGTFVTSVKVNRPGRVTVRAVHPATPELAAARARAVKVRVVRASAGPGSRGPLVRALQRRLARVGYAVTTTGSYDARTARGVLAFRKVTGMNRTSSASEDVFRRLLKGGGAFRVRYPKAGRHVEADLSRQVLALIEGRRVVRIYPTSTGAAATPTVLGSYRVYMKTPGTNGSGMVDSNYFIRGYAIHGYPSVPTFPASHGCLRVPIPDARPIFNWLRQGDGVIVYR
jgi:peptidoglycan hydrolase-like protein with peptidoglycan-binding domain